MIIIIYPFAQVERSERNSSILLSFMPDVGDVSYIMPDVSYKHECMLHRNFKTNVH